MAVIQARVAWYRNLVVGIVALGAIPIGWAIVRRSLVPLWVLASIVPLCGAFFYLDNDLVGRWKSRILELWERDGLSLKHFEEAVVQIRTLPPRTLRDMLDTLPTQLGSGCLSADARRVLVLTLGIIGRCQGDRIASITAAYSLGLAVLMTAGLLRSWSLLPGVLLAPAAVVAGRWLEALRLRAWSRRIGAFVLGRSSSREKWKYL